MTPREFVEKWRVSTLKERSAAQEHFIDLCRLIGEKTPAEADPDLSLRSVGIFGLLGRARGMDFVAFFPPKMGFRRPNL